MNPCPICLRREATVTDHDHATGLVRGRLCNYCNTGLGQLGDDIEAMQRAILYLQRDPEGTLFVDVKRERLRHRMREWRAKHPDRDRANQRAWVETHRETMREATRRSRANDPDGAKRQRATEVHRQWLIDNPDKLAEIKRKARERYHARMQDPAERAKENERNRERHALRKAKRAT